MILYQTVNTNIDTIAKIIEMNNDEVVDNISMTDSESIKFINNILKILDEAKNGTKNELSFYKLISNIFNKENKKSTDESSSYVEIHSENILNYNKKDKVRYLTNHKLSGYKYILEIFNYMNNIYDNILEDINKYLNISIIISDNNREYELVTSFIVSIEPLNNNFISYYSKNFIVSFRDYFDNELKEIKNDNYINTDIKLIERRLLEPLYQDTNCKLPDSKVVKNILDFINISNNTELEIENTMNKIELDSLCNFITLNNDVRKNTYLEAIAHTSSRLKDKDILYTNIKIIKE